LTSVFLRFGRGLMAFRTKENWQNQFLYKNSTPSVAQISDLFFPDWHLRGTGPI
jgi:hypothetical protein